MNKFGSRAAGRLVDELRSSACAFDESLPSDIIALLRDAADTIEAAQHYHGAVESALI